MQVDRVGDPAEFAGRAAPLLLRDEARHALQLGLCTTVVERPDVYPENRLWLVRAEGVVVVVGMLTPPFNMTVSRPDAEDALAALAAAVHEDGLVIPGVTGAVPEVEGFVEAWRERTGAGAHRAMSQRIYRLSSVRTVTAVRGLMRRAKQGDRELLIEWMAAFAVEALPADSPTNAERVVDL